MAGGDVDVAEAVFRPLIVFKKTTDEAEAGGEAGGCLRRMIFLFFRPFFSSS